MTNIRSKSKEVSIEQKVLTWARERSIIPDTGAYDTELAWKVLTTQSMKLSAELAELVETTTTKGRDDAIGDMLVVSLSINNALAYLTEEISPDTSLLEILHKDVQKSVNEAIPKEYLKMSTISKIVGALGNLHDSIIKEDTVSADSWFIYLVGVLVNSYCEKADFGKYLTLAYNEIKDRQGKTLSNGNFVKDEK